MTLKPTNIQFKIACDLLDTTHESVCCIVNTDQKNPRQTIIVPHKPITLDSASVDLVSIQNGRAVTTDLLISKLFNKPLSVVRRAIRTLKCSEDFRFRNLIEIVSIDSNSKRKPIYIITKDGFFLLMISFSEKDTTELQMQYIQAFNNKEKYLHHEIGQFNQLCLRFNLRKQEVSQSARNMVCWKGDKPKLLKQLEQAKKRLQLDLFDDDQDD